jgi:hypothetical protein
VRRVVLSWLDVEALLEHLLPQFYGTFDVLLMIADGGLVPGGLIAERLNMTRVLTASVHFPAELPRTAAAPLGAQPPPVSVSPGSPTQLGLPRFLLFPDDALLREQRTLVVHHVWNHGRTINAVAGRVAAAGGSPALCVLHYKPSYSIFPHLKPDYYAAVTSDYIVYPWEVGHRLEPYRPMTELA